MRSLHTPTKSYLIAIASLIGLLALSLMLQTRSMTQGSAANILVAELEVKTFELDIAPIEMSFHSFDVYLEGFSMVANGLNQHIQASASEPSSVNGSRGPPWSGL
jgi:hypothetical protein